MLEHAPGLHLQPLSGGQPPREEILVGDVVERVEADFPPLGPRSTRPPRPRGGRAGHRVRLPVRGRRGAGGRGSGGGIAPERLRAAAVGALQPPDAPRGGGDGGDVLVPAALELGQRLQDAVQCLGRLDPPAELREDVVQVVCGVAPLPLDLAGG